ncbi:HIT family protein [Microlunatus soli]|uniref:Histidine triad (HIT) family protein n=1 Tax=Microlunatus soli TaxID=630515 RepID=A0A1H1QPL5_9ACTN|nr:HIT family protein [Microlunatus soli]SDS25374.1 histidine triad (HIT) family protein [Microlunatus soli]
MNSDCVFCSLLRDEGAADWIWRGQGASALLPLEDGRLAPGHTLVIADQHAVGVQDVSPAALTQVILLVQQVSVALRDAFGARGVNVLNASGPDSDQSVDHLHFHVVPRWAADGLDTWPGGRSGHRLGTQWPAELRRAVTARQL